MSIYVLPSSTGVLICQYLDVQILYFYILFDWEDRDKESLGHTARKWQNWKLNPGCPPLKLLLKWEVQLQGNICPCAKPQMLLLTDERRNGRTCAEVRAPAGPLLLEGGSGTEELCVAEAGLIGAGARQGHPVRGPLQTPTWELLLRFKVGFPSTALGM